MLPQSECFVLTAFIFTSHAIPSHLHTFTRLYSFFLFPLWFYVSLWALFFLSTHKCISTLIEGSHFEEICANSLWEKETYSHTLEKKNWNTQLDDLSCEQRGRKIVSVSNKYRCSKWHLAKRISIGKVTSPKNIWLRERERMRWMEYIRWKSNPIKQHFYRLKCVI